MSVDTRAPDEDAMVRAAVADIERRLRSDSPRIERTVRRLVRELSDRSRVKTFVGVIAERHALEELRSESDAQSPES